MRWFLILALLFAGPAYAAYSPDVIPTTDSNTTLRNIPTTATSYVWRMGYATPGDAPALLFKKSTSVCAWNAGDGDGGSEVKSLDGKCWIGQFPATGADIRQWGAVCNGDGDNPAVMHNDVTAIRTALSSVEKTIVGPNNKVCWVDQVGGVSYPIVIPWGSTLMGFNRSNLELPSGIPGGFTIKCSLNVSPCVNVQGALVGVGVDRHHIGTPPAGTIGIFVGGGGQSNVVDNVSSYRSPVSIKVGDEASGGTYAYLTNIQTCIASDTHLWHETWAVLRVAHSTFGCNGGFDVDSNNYIKVTGHNANGLTVVSSQFNQGSAGHVVNCWLNFSNLTGINPPPYLFFFDSIHVEVVNRGICSDSTAALIGGVHITNSDFYGGFSTVGAPFLWLDPASKAESWKISNNFFNGWDNFRMAMTPAGGGPGFTDILISNNFFNTTGTLGFSFDGVAGSTLVAAGNNYHNITLGGVFKDLLLTGIADSLVNTANGKMSIDIPGHSQSSCNALLFFGGGSTGITYSVGPICRWQRHGDLVTFSFFMTLSSKGTSTGIANIGGLPYPGAASGPGNGSTPIYTTAMTGLTGGVTATTGSGVELLNLYQAGPAGVLAMDNTQFTNTSTLQGNVTYAVDPGL